LDALALIEWTFPGIDPALVTIPSFSVGDMTLGPFPVRWYALAYIIGIVVGWRYMLMLARRPALWSATNATSPLKTDAVDDFLFWATIGVLIGGRVGYVLFYLLPYAPEQVMSDPLTIFRLWEGGMSFHGGLIGVILALVLVARSHKVPLLSIGDAVACAAPIGLMLGRLANFINAELYGRVSDAPWAMKFPSYDWTSREWVYSGLEQARHPSQLYEAALEGAVLFIVLAVAVWVFKSLRRPGLTSGIFLIGYAAARTFVETFREPDAHIGFLDNVLPGLTMGMLLSAPMIVGGLALVLIGANRRPSAG
jgi:phosphatidylglycerol:prolipoprotein diacylglycerol transferase